MLIQTLFNPTSLKRWCAYLRPWSAASSFVFFAVGLCWAWIGSPVDYQHGSTIRILYIHVSASWLALSIFASMGILAAGGLIGKFPTAPLMVKALCPIGLTFTSLSLITGSLWGQPAWGTWWVWDARLTSMALLWVQYWGCYALQQGFRDKKKGLHLASLFVIIGLVNLPIIKWSVTWWATLHQPASVMRWGAPRIHESFMGPLVFMVLGAIAYTVWIFTLRLPKELHKACTAETLRVASSSRRGI